MSKDHPRLILHNFLSPDVCKELEFIHKSCGTIGYRPNVFSTTLTHLASTNSAHLIMPLVPIRERLLEKVEEFFGCQYELVIEFTGFMSWTKGASIGWHSDDNRPYLKQRHFAAVCYLNSYNKDFKGGLFRFQDGEPSIVTPMAGDVVMYTADEQNIHSVDEITEGERVTLTLWFSRDQAHSEDEKVISFLSQGLADHFDSCVPVPASNSMYWFPPDEALKFLSGFDIRCARLHVLGLDLYSPDEHICDATTNSSSYSLEVLMRPLQILKGNQLFQMEFANVLHVLQVVQFYCWKDLELETIEAEDLSLKLKRLSCEELEQVDRLKQVVSKDRHMGDTFFLDPTSGRNMHDAFQWNRFFAAVVEWERYTRKLHDDLVRMLPNWRKHTLIFSYHSECEAI